MSFVFAKCNCIFVENSNIMTKNKTENKSSSANKKAETKNAAKKTAEKKPNEVVEEAAEEAAEKVVEETTEETAEETTEETAEETTKETTEETVEEEPKKKELSKKEINHLCGLCESILGGAKLNPRRKNEIFFAIEEDPRAKVRFAQKRGTPAVDDMLKAKAKEFLRQHA